MPVMIELALPDAREQLDDVDLQMEEVDDFGEDRVFLSSRDWTAVSQEPAAGTEVEPGSPVEVRLLNVRDTADSDKPEESKDSILAISQASSRRRKQRQHRRGVRGIRQLHDEHDSARDRAGHGGRLYGRVPRRRDQCAGRDRHGHVSADRRVRQRPTAQGLEYPT